MNSDQKGLRVAGIILICFGSFFTVMGVLLGGGLLIAALVANSLFDRQEENFEDFMDHAVETAGIVLEAGDGHTVVGYFDEDNIWYETELSIYYSKYNEGSDITVYYNEKNPEECVAPELTVLSSVLPDIMLPLFYGSGSIFLVIFLLFGIPPLIIGIILKKKSDQK